MELADVSIAFLALIVSIISLIMSSRNSKAIKHWQNEDLKIRNKEKRLKDNTEFRMIRHEVEKDIYDFIVNKLSQKISSVNSAFEKELEKASTISRVKILDEEKKPLHFFLDFTESYQSLDNLKSEFGALNNLDYMDLKKEDFIDEKTVQILKWFYENINEEKRLLIANKLEPKFQELKSSVVMHEKVLADCKTRITAAFHKINTNSDISLDKELVEELRELEKFISHINAIISIYIKIDNYTKEQENYLISHLFLRLTELKLLVKKAQKYSNYELTL